MKSPNFDEKVKSLFENDMELPPELVWEEMDFSAAFDQKKRKKRFIFFWFGALVFLVGSLLFWQTLSIQNIEKSADDIEKNLTPELNNQNITSLNDTKLLIPKKTIFNSNQTPSQIVISPKQIPPSSLFNSMESPTLSNSNLSLASKKNQDIPNLSNKIIPAKPISNNKITSHKNPLFLTSLKSQLKNQQLDSINIPPVFQTKINHSKFSIVFMSGINQFSNRFSTSNDFIQKLEESESSRIGFYGKLLFRKKINPFLRIGSGIQMEVFHTFFEASDVLPTKIQNTFTQVVITDQTRFVKHNNYYQSLSIPFTLDLVLNSTHKWNFGVGLEANLGFWSKATGRHFNDLGEIVYLSENELFQSSNHFNLAIGGNSSIEYNLNAKAKFIFNLGYSRQLNNISGPDRMAANRPINFYSGLGVQYNF